MRLLRPSANIFWRVFARAAIVSLSPREYSTRAWTYRRRRLPLSWVGRLAHENISRDSDVFYANMNSGKRSFTRSWRVRQPKKAKHNGDAPHGNGRRTCMLTSDLIKPRLQQAGRVLTVE